MKQQHDAFVGHKYFISVIIMRYYHLTNTVLTCKNMVIAI